MVSWYRLEEDVIERKGWKQCEECLSFTTGSSCLSSAMCRDDIVWAKGRGFWKKCAYTSVHLSEGTVLATGLGVHGQQLHPLLFSSSLHMVSWLLKLGCLGSNPNSPLSSCLTLGKYLIFSNKELVEVCEDEVSRWAKAPCSVPSLGQATPPLVSVTQGSDRPASRAGSRWPLSSQTNCAIGSSV